MKSTATLNPVLTGLAQKFMRDPGGFVGSILFPPFSSGVASADYYVFDAENLLAVPQNIRHAPGTGFKRIVSKLSDDNYACADYGIEHAVSDQERKKYANQFDADSAATRRITDIIKINHELRVKTKATDTSVVPNAAIAVKWNDPASNPKDDVDAAKESIRQAIGAMPNVMTFSRPVMTVLEQHPKLLEVFKYTAAGLVNADKIAQYFGIAKIAIAEQVIATSQQGQAVTAADIWGDDIVLAHVNPGQDLSLLNFGRTFFWDEFGSIGQDGVPIRIEDYRDETVQSDIHRAQHFTDEKRTGATAGFLLTDALA